MNTALERNIRAIGQREAESERNASLQDRIADRITGFTGSMIFVYLHLTGFGFWIAANLGWIPGVPQWDPTFVVLAMFASVEAIFLSTFVLISQNRMAAAADRRANLNLQITLLIEHELTKMGALLLRMADRLDVPAAQDPETREVENEVAPEVVYDALKDSED
ncbi:DUF1003 domain-containing protein [Paracoccus shandongensis]|uniref:DUF1003 domain-containing protein n=1 Tax=Paracoccus shandongensis TaxID=2816048 RepID=UPI001A8C4675|nr:DUF1003 domain-containing protein [Paracoccus shandongensis]